MKESQRKTTILEDSSGSLWELLEMENGNVIFRSKNYPDISHTYKKQFIEDAIQGGLLSRIEEPGTD